MQMRAQMKESNPYIFGELMERDTAQWGNFLLSVVWVFLCVCTHSCVCESMHVCAFCGYTSAIISDVSRSSGWRNKFSTKGKSPNGQKTFPFSFINCILILDKHQDLNGIIVHCLFCCCRKSLFCEWFYICCR